MRMRRYLACSCVALVAALVLVPSVAFAYQEPNTLTGSGCTYCHAVVPDGSGGFTLERRPVAGGDCDACHTPYSFSSAQGPHGGYATSSRKCEACHSVHAAPAGGIKLLAGNTIKASCQSCHDGTGGHGVYGTIEERGGTPGAQHRCEETNVILGGDANSGGSSTRAFRGDGGNMTCSDCHSPHGSKVVAPFYGDRKRVRSDSPPPLTSKLLKKQPTGAAAPVDEYGSDWCLGCHEGRSSTGFVHNHPVDSGSGAFTYGNVAVLDSDAPTGNTVLGPLGGVASATMHTWLPQTDPPGNRGYLMPYPRTPEQGTHKPICQQCHEDSRRVGTLSADGATGDAETAQIAQADGLAWSGAWVDSASDNPKFQNFPHETVNGRMLVEPADDLCLNCHPASRLP